MEYLTSCSVYVSHGRGPPRHTLYRDHSFEPSNLMAFLKHVLVSEICLHLFPHMYTETMMCWRWAVGTALDFWPMGFVFTQCGDDGAIKRCCSVSLERLSTPGNKRELFQPAKVTGADTNDGHLAVIGHQGPSLSQHANAHQRNMKSSLNLILTPQWGM